MRSTGHTRISGTDMKNPNHSKPLIAHVIDSLGRGGAEQMVRAPLKQLKAYRHLIIILNEPVDLSDIPGETQVINLRYKGSWDVIGCISRLRSTLKAAEVSLIHSHLMLSTFLCRMAKPSGSSLISSYHSLLHDPKSNQYRFTWKWLDRITCFRSNHHIYVSNQVKAMYEHQVSSKVSGRVIYNYVNPIFYNAKSNQHATPPRRLICVGNYRPEKDHRTLMSAFIQLPDHYELTLVGQGFEKSDYTEMPGVSILATTQVVEILSDHHIYVSTSTFEGFGISVVEAMAAGLPCLLADIPTFREVLGDDALYFEKGNDRDLRNQLARLAEDNNLRSRYSAKSRTRAARYSMRKYVTELNSLYQEVGQRH